MDRTRERGPEFTVTFLNKSDLDEDTVRSMFNEFGRVVYVSEKNGRYFVRYKEKDQAEAAIEKYGRELGVDFARDRNAANAGNRQPKQDRDRDRDQQQDQDRDWGKNRDGDRERDRNQDSRPSRNFDDWERDRNRDSRPSRNFDDDRRSDTESKSLLGPVPTDQSHGDRNRRSKPVTPGPPELIDSATLLPEKFLFILGNLPSKFSQEEILLLIEETKPLHIGTIDRTSLLQLNFCPIHLDSMEKIIYLQNKLDGFTVGGNQLVAMGVHQLFEEAQSGPVF